jgi:hypothetical protein
MPQLDCVETFELEREALRVPLGTRFRRRSLAWWYTLVKAPARWRGYLGRRHSEPDPWICGRQQSRGQTHLCGASIPKSRNDNTARSRGAAWV